MTTPSPRHTAGFLLRCIALFSLLAASAPPSQVARAQDQRRDEDDDEVLRVSTNLIQTDVTVLDKQGRPVTDLRAEQFELKVDGRVQPLLFFERVTAGSAGEAAALRSARGATPSAPATAVAASRPAPSRGRSVIFFIDDLHLTTAGAARARDVLLDHVERRHTPGTPTLIASTSGQVGFLQQFTDDRAVLRAAARRVRYQAAAGDLDQDPTPMSERNAFEIDRGNRGVINYYILSFIRDNPSRMDPVVRRDVVEQMVRQRAQTILDRASHMSEATITSLEMAVGARGAAPGRRVLFFVSEGFMLNNRRRDIGNKYRRVIAAAARAGTVVYTLDARGLAVPMLDAGSKARGDIELDADLSVLNPSADMTSTQEVLRGLAADTGGRALLNTNALEQAVGSALGETAEYYVLAWRPESADATGRSPQFRRVEASVRGRPDLTVRVRSGFLDARAEGARQPTASEAAGDATPAGVTLNAALSAVIAAPTERRALPVELYAIYNGDAGSPPSLTALVQLSEENVEFAPVGGNPQAEVSVACVVLDDKGKSVFSEGRTLTLTRAAGGEGRVITQFPVPLAKPGLYQVRVAARDARGGLVGSAFQWVEAPDLKATQLSLSTPVIVESQAASAAASKETPQAVSLKIDRHYARASRLLLEMYVYNAARAAGGANVEMEIKVWRDGRVALGAPPHKLADAGAADPTRIRYNAEVPLRGLAPGQYILEVIAADRTARATATRQVSFTVE